MPAPFGPLKYLYTGVRDTDEALAYYRDVLGARVVWDYREFDAHVAAVEVGVGPLVLLADHEPAPSALHIYEVRDLEATAGELRARGWEAQDGPFEVPDGPCYTFADPSGNRFAILQVIRPDALMGDG